jgi:hypothetical protein
MRIRCRCMEVRPVAEGAQLLGSVESALGGVPSSCSAGDISRREGTTPSHVIACCQRVRRCGHGKVQICAFGAWADVV